MPSRCYVCGKGTVTGYKVSHSNIKTKRKWKANIQKIRILINNASRKVNVCSRCIKGGKIQRAQ